MAKQSKFKRALKKYITIFVISGFIWCPITLKWTLTNPDRAVVYGIKLAIVGTKINNRVCKITRSITPKPISKFYDVWIRDLWAFNKEVVASTQSTPKPGLFVRVGTGVLGGMKKLFGFII